MAVSIYPTGTTIYDPELCWNGYTLYQTSMWSGKKSSAVLIDMNGNIVNQWRGLDGFPNKMLPGGNVMGSSGARNPKYGFQDMADLVQADWDGHIVWSFKRHERVKDPRRKPTWMARQHHDYQREGNSVGYYAPGMEPRVDGGKTIILTHRNLKNPVISEHILLDDVIIEVDWSGKIVWEWVCSDHYEEMGFSEDARNILARNPNMVVNGGDWMHMNCICQLGPNKWFDQGDKRFHPDNIIWDGRQTNIIGITEKKTGEIVWKIGPDYRTSPELKKIGWIIGQHHAHMIPHGLPGAGNILLFDNGGWAGYGAPNPGSPSGLHNAIRDHSRVLEINPVTLEIVWECGGRGPGPGPGKNLQIYSSFVSSAQRLSNGNTMITEGGGGRIIEVTPEQKIVWEYISPYVGKRMHMTMVYRAYRVPYEWVPQADRPTEKAIPRLDNSKFRVPNTSPQKIFKVTDVK